MSLLKIQKVSRFFGGIAAIKDVSFEVRKDEILGLIGPNGAGKTTLFNVVNGFYRPSRGDVFFQDRKISGLMPHQICQSGIARTFQVVKPLQRMSVLDNVGCIVISSREGQTRGRGDRARLPPVHGSRCRP